jgi:hypothetical protein
MELVLLKLKYLMSSAQTYFEKADRAAVEAKPAPDKWSKKEILGHLVDSAINNIQRFTEIQTHPKPYQIRPYDPDALVLANDYQNKDLDELFALWHNLNLQVKFIVEHQTEATQKYATVLPNGETKDLKFVINDYVDHLEHHLDQIYH